MTLYSLYGAHTDLVVTYGQSSCRRPLRAAAAPTTHRWTQVFVAWLTSSTTAEVRPGHSRPGCLTHPGQEHNSRTGDRRPCSRVLRAYSLSKAPHNTGENRAQTRRDGSMLTRYDPFREALSL